MWTKSLRAGVAGSLLALCLCGCTVTSYQSPSGERFKRVAVGNNTSVGELSVTGDTNGVRKLSLKSYANDQTQALGAVTEAAVRAALEATK